MRWIFANPADAVESERRERKVRQIARWWDAFASKTADLVDLFSRRSEWDLPAWMHENLGAVDPQLMWEFSRDGEGHRLVITPEGARHLRPLAQAVLGAAPKIAGWRFYGYRQAESVKEAAADVMGRTGVDVAQTTVRVRAGAFNTVDLTFVSPACRSPEDRTAFEAAFIAAQALLGEEMLDKWVGVVRVSPPVAGERTIPLDRLRPTVRAVLQHVREQLPDAPCHQWPDDTQWSSFKMPLYDAPRSAADAEPEYPGRSDLLVGITMVPQVFQFAHGDWPFFSERFSRWGETFCYVKFDGSSGMAGSSFADRAALEDALNAALRPAGAGCVIGGGTGLRYAYTDLALTDLHAGVAAVRRVLQDGRVPRRSWVLFYDAALQAEWVGIYDDTPEPPVEPG